MNYPKPDYQNQFFNCYRDGDNPVIVFKGLQNGGKVLWMAVHQATIQALDWAQEDTGQASQPYRGIVLTLPTFGGWRVYFGARYITATRTSAACAGVRFERLSDVQKFKAAVSKVM